MATKAKTKDAVGDRFKVTKNGKVLRRSMGIGHSRTRQTKKSLLTKRSHKPVSGVTHKELKAY